MVFIKRSLWFILLLISLIIAGYASFPWWASPLIQRGMPVGWQVNAVDLNYPGWRSLSIHFIDIQSSELRVKASRIDYDWVSRRLIVADLAVEQLSEKQAAEIQPAAVTLPEFNLNRLLAILPFSDLQVATVSWMASQSDLPVLDASDLVKKPAGLTKISLENLSLKVQSTASASVKFTLQPNLYLEKTSHWIFDLNHRRGEWLINTLYNGEALFDAGYINKQNEQQLRLNFPLQNALNLLPPDAVFEQFKPQGQVEFRFVQNLTQKSAQINVTMNGDFSSPILNLPRINFKLTSETNSPLFPLDLVTSLHLSTEKNLLLTEQITLLKPKAKINAVVRLAQDPKQEPLRFSQLKGRFNADSLEIRSGQQQAKLGKFSLDFAHPDIDLRNFAAKQSRLQVTLNESSLNINSLSNTPLLSGKLAGSGQIAVATQVLQQGQFTLSAMQVDKLYRTESAPFKLKLNQIKSDLSSGSLSLAFNDSANTLADFAYQQLRSEISASLHHGDLIGQGNIFLNQQLLTPLKFSWHKASEKLMFELPQNPVANALINETISQYIPPKTLKIALKSGKVTHHGSLQSSQPLTFQSTIQLSNGTIELGKTQVSPLTISSQIKFAEQLNSETNLTANQVVFESGLALTDLTAKLVSKGNEPLKIEALNLSVMQGQAHSDLITITGSDITSAPFTINQLSLKDFFAMLDIEGLTMDGKVNVQGNITTEAGVFSIKEFHFKNTEPGTLKYAKGESLGLANTIAAKALSNFRYTEFEGEITNATRSEIPLKIRLLGTNPDLKLDRPLEITLNLSNQVDAKELTDLLKRLVRE